MAEQPAVRGTGIAGDKTNESILSMLDKKLGDANMQPRGLATGPTTDKAFKTSFDEQTLVLTGMTGTQLTVEVKHDLGRVPGYVKKVGARSGFGAAPPHVSLADVDYDRWTETVAKVEVLLLGPGGLEGVMLTVEVGGHRG